VLFKELGFFNKETMSRFKVKVLPAITDEKKKTALWPEWMDYNELMARKRELGEKIFNQEYLCSPVYSEDSWFKKDEILSVVNINLENEQRLDTDNDVILGWDLGKKRHPSHIAIFEVVNNRFIQRYNLFLDGVDYIRQLRIVNDLIDRFQVDYGWYDATRGELESLSEQKKINNKQRYV